ncbi:hypothetical protein PFISCL1PPCAC_1274, partial [Pristionchus fissidentatus]
EYIEDELKKMRLDDVDLEEGSAVDEDSIEGTPIVFEDDEALQTVKETRSINESLIPHMNVSGVAIHPSLYSSSFLFSNESDPFSTEGSVQTTVDQISSFILASHPSTIECSIVQEEFLKDCYSELADRTSDWMAPLPIHIFAFSTAEIRDLCEDYKRTTENCLGPHFDLNCTGSHTVNTMDNRVGTMCTASLSQSFGEDFECLKRVTTKKGCDSAPSSPSSDCSSSPEFLCHSRRALLECSPDAFDLFISTVFTLGCN